VVDHRDLSPGFEVFLGLEVGIVYISESVQRE
jgi:hypothetical protein